ncbi:hypothetical protein H0H93_003399 [Arthromyces matolae]|nr:hypothetical protein H0H93_003399 [Arthromyces matolae]
MSIVDEYPYSKHNWDNAGSYPITLMQDANSAFAGVAFHCYVGNVSQQDIFHNAYPDKVTYHKATKKLMFIENLQEIYFTECMKTLQSQWWSDIKALMWNIALDGSGKPMLPGTNSCGRGCRPLVTINSDGSYSLNQEFYAMAQASKAIYPKDAGGPYGQRIAVLVGGSLSRALRVGAYVTERVSSTDCLRYSIVVLNCKLSDSVPRDDSASTTWNPVPVSTTIEFRGAQATYTFPVGVTTLWWFAPAVTSATSLFEDGELRFNATTFIPGNTTYSTKAN